MTDELSRLARIETKLDDLTEWVKAESHRVGSCEKDITGLKVRDAYWAGGVMGVVGILKLIFWK